MHEEILKYTRYTAASDPARMMAVKQFQVVSFQPHFVTKESYFNS